ncbi:alanine racemase [Methylocapsa acidiphila]|uniref:alanine racemase n=1 Tax=Methylocapsa acidiphila TaxID=133552 RepID=UPI000416FFAC|nr:alanine racemase [Methylocapsa acidiphila]
MPSVEISPLEAGCVLTVDLSALVANWRTLQTVCGEAECGAAVKADAYGLGLEPVAKALHDAGCRTFFVAHVFEGRTLRALAPDADIYVLDGLRPGAAAAYADHALRPVLGSVPEMEDFGQFCATSGRRWPDGSSLKAALRLDAGRRQLGLSAYDLDRADHLAPLFDVTLLLGEIARRDGEDPAEAQIDAFDAMRARFPGRRASLANSSAIFLDAIPLYDLVRPGYALYGGNPTPGRPNPMRPVVTLEAKIIQMRILEPGMRIGEDLAWKAKGPRRIALVAAGFADGLPIAMTDNKARSGGVALAQGRRCAFVGPIAMDHAALDVSDAGYLERGETVELIGKTITIDDFAAQAGMRGAEALVHLGRRCHRRYRQA